MILNKALLKERVKLYENEYKKFMNIEKFPGYKLLTKEVSLDIANKQGFESIANEKYNIQLNEHILTVSTNIIPTKELLFHEFTHMLDSELFVKGDKIRYAGISGYTEYHASQIELMKMLGAKNIKDSIAFSMSDRIETFSGNKTVFEYVRNKQQHAIDLFERNDFPADLPMLKTAIGIVFNYWGLRSICELYANDYEEIIDNSAFLKYIPSQIFVSANNMMHGWLEDEQVENSIQQYISIIFPLIQQYKLA